MSKLLRHILGWSCLVLGIAGLVLPILQGWLFLALGALLLAPDIPIFKRMLDWIERKFPFLKKPLRRWRSRLTGEKS